MGRARVTQTTSTPSLGRQRSTSDPAPLSRAPVPLTPLLALLDRDNGRVSVASRQGDTERSGDIRTEDIFPRAIDNKQLEDGSVLTAAIADGAVTSDKLAADAKFASGTKMVFFQAAAPTGWTKDTSQNDKALRVVSGAGGGSGGSQGLSSTIILAHSHSNPAHEHDLGYSSVVSLAADAAARIGTSDSADQPIYQLVAGASTMRHLNSRTLEDGNTTSNSQLSNVSLAYIDVIICTKD